MMPDSASRVMPVLPSFTLVTLGEIPTLLELADHEPPGVDLFAIHALIFASIHSNSNWLAHESTVQQTSVRYYILLRIRANFDIDFRPHAN